MKQSGWRGCGLALTSVLIGMGSIIGPQVGAQVAKPPVTTPAIAKISGQNGPYRIEWNGTSGTFTRSAVKSEPEEKMPLVYLQTDPGPNGYAKHLAWFLARDKDKFALLWCYLDDSGHSFWCWLYRYPANQLLTVQFVGDYQYGPPPPGEKPTITDNFLTAEAPFYTGTDFAYRDWTRKGGKLENLTLGTGLATGQALTLDPGKGTKPLTGLRVLPLHEIEVGQGNGWRPGGWRELHALAYDSANDPYYLILYSNTTIGYAVDLKRAQPYVADFGERVKFGSETIAFGPNGKPINPTDTPRILRNTRYEITLNTARRPDNAYTEINLDAELRGPDGKMLRIPGYWDGGNVFRVRFLPMKLGSWTWHILSNDPELNAKSGSFECVAESGTERGFLHITPLRANQRHFVTGGATPFYPVYTTGSVSQDWYRSQTVPGAGQTRTASLTAGRQSAAETFAAFQKRIDALAAQGFNRIYGDFLLPVPNAPYLFAKNEGGSEFEGDNLDLLNPAFFQAMDKRIAYCNLKGIIPDLGISSDAEAVYGKYNDIQIRRFWRYVLGRYACYDICWNLFGHNAGTGKAPPIALDPHIEGLAALTRLYDPYTHPLTTLTRFVQTATGNAAAPWEDVLTVPLYDTATVDYLYAFNRPVLVVDTPDLAGVAPAGKEGKKPAEDTPDSIRHRMWETHMRGAYWASDRPLDEQQTQWVVYSARFFEKTRYWRMEPHQEMLGGPEETPAVRRRRKQAETDAHKKNPNAPLPTDDMGKVIPSGPIFVLADPSHEYVIYFEKGGAVTLDLLEATGHIKVTWFNPRTGDSREEAGMVGGAYQTFIAPDANDWVLYISRH